MLRRATALLKRMDLRGIAELVEEDGNIAEVFDDPSAHLMPEVAA